MCCEGWGCDVRGGGGGVMWKLGYIGVRIATGLTAVHYSSRCDMGMVNISLMRSLAHIEEKIEHR